MVSVPPAFQSTLPAWGETAACTARSRARTFQSTLPAWGETLPAGADRRGGGNFNPLSPHGERPIHDPRRSRPKHFNPLSPHGERRAGTSNITTAEVFQSTLPAWGETGSRWWWAWRLRISIHSPRMGRDDTRRNCRGGRKNISIHSPRMGRDGCLCMFVSAVQNFNPLSPHGERRCSGREGNDW